LYRQSVLFTLGVLLLIIVAACGQIPASTDEQAAPTSSAVVEEAGEDMIINAVQFAGISEKQLIELLGEPESKEDWSFSSANGQKYKALTYVYDNGNQEFLFIDGKVVRFTFYGTGQKYKDGKHALALFGIEPGPNITLVTNTGSAIKYQRVHESMKIDEFWLIEDSEKTIGTVKITYDSRYF